MCIVCEHQLYEEHRNAGQPCYHCFSIGNTIDECPECLGKPWSEEFLETKAKIDNDFPTSIH